MVINSGPLILLEKIGRLALLDELPVKFVLPSAVHHEFTIKRISRDLPKWLEVIPLSPPFPSLLPLVNVSLDRGEFEVIQLALEKNIDRVCIDDLKGRNAARSVGLRVTGLLGLFSMAKRMDIIPQVRPYIDLVIGVGGWYSRSLIGFTLREAGEDASDFI